MPWKCDYYETDTLLRKKGQLSSTWVSDFAFSSPLLSTLSKDVYDQEWNPWRWWSWFLIILEISPFLCNSSNWLIKYVCSVNGTATSTMPITWMSIAHQIRCCCLFRTKNNRAWVWTLAQAGGCWHCVFECRKNRQNIFTSKYLHHKHFYETCF